MTVEDAQRKIALLRRICVDKGALPAERETAYRIQKLLMERYAIKPQDIPDPSPTPAFGLTWSYWQELLEEFGLRLERLGNRGSAAVGYNRRVYVRLDKSEWWVEERSKSGWQTKVRNCSIESLRNYLKAQGPRSSSVFRR